MEKCMITFRSVMPAQQGQALMRRAGVSCDLRRTPRRMEQQGCGYSLHVNCGQIHNAVALLDREGVAYRKIYRITNTGMEEMHL